jgi:hypothetical protein
VKADRFGAEQVVPVSALRAETESVYWESTTPMMTSMTFVPVWPGEKSAFTAQSAPFDACCARATVGSRPAY